MNPIAVMLSVAHSVAEISHLVGTWHTTGYLWSAAPNVTEIPPGSWQRRVYDKQLNAMNKLLGKLLQS